MDRIEFHPIPADDNDKQVDQAFPKRKQTEKLLEEKPSDIDLTEELEKLSN